MCNTLYSKAANVALATHQQGIDLPLAVLRTAAACSVPAEYIWKEIRYRAAQKKAAIKHQRNREHAHQERMSHLYD